MQTQSLNRRYRLLAIGSEGVFIGVMDVEYDTLFDAKKAARHHTEDFSPHAQILIQDTETGEIVVTYRGLDLSSLEFKTNGKPH